MLEEENVAQETADEESADEESADEKTADEEPAAVEVDTRAPRIQVINACAFAVSTVLAFAAVAMLFTLLNANARAEKAHARYDTCVAATVQLMDASDYLTSESQIYVVSGDPKHLNGYLTELSETKRRDDALATLERESGDPQAVEELTRALRDSNELAERELYAMRLTAESTGLSPLPAQLETVQLSSEDAALSADGKKNLAIAMLLGSEYNSKKSMIVQGVDDCANALIGELERDENDVQALVDRLMLALFAIVVLLVVIMGVAVIANYRLIMWPMRVHARNIRDNEPLEHIGSRELRYVVNAYNQIYDENHHRTMLLKREAETDALTGLLNRGSYDKALKHYGDDIALVIFDVDLFKSVNDNLGHDMGDDALKKVAKAIDYHFRSTDYVCRIGGDEFAVIMTEVHPDVRNIIETKLKLIAADLLDTADGLPEITLSVGVAFSAELPKDGNIYHAADKALYDAKHKGRNTFSFYSDMQES